MPSSASNQKNLRWFEIAEYGSLAGAFAGLLYQQLLCVPLLATFIWLSQKNRRSVEEATARNISITTNQVQQQISQRITSIQKSIYSSDEYLKLSDASTIQEQVGQLQHKLSQVSDRIDEVPTLSPPDLNEVERKIEQLSDGLSAIHSLDLASLFEKVAQFQQNLEQVKASGLEIGELKTQLNQFTHHIEHLEQVSKTQLQEAISALTEKVEPALEAITLLDEQLANVTISSQDEQQKTEKLVQAIAELKNQLDHLPPSPEPFDPTLIQQEINAVGNAVQSLQQLVKDQDDKFTGEQAEKTEKIASLEQHLQDYLTIKDFASWQRQVAASESSEIVAIRKEIEKTSKVVVTLKEQIQTTLPKEEFVLWQQSVASLDEVAGIKNQIAGLIAKVEGYSIPDFQTQLNTTKEQVNQLEEHLNDLDHSCQDLHDATRPFAKMQDQLEVLTSSKDNSIDIENWLKEFSERFKGQVDKSLGNHLHDLNQMLRNVQPGFEYKLVSNRFESRQYFLKALNEAEERLVMVCPWLTKYSIDSVVKAKLRNALKREISINIGWGHLKDIETVEPGEALWEQLRDHPKQSWAYNAINCLMDLESTYLKLKIIGTHEKYIVCDRKFAVVGSHNFLTSGDNSSEREIGLYTTDPRIIDELIMRFDKARDLEFQSPSRVPAGSRAST